MVLSRIWVRGHDPQNARQHGVDCLKIQNNIGCGVKSGQSRKKLCSNAGIERIPALYSAVLVTQSANRKNPLKSTDTNALRASF